MGGLEEPRPPRQTDGVQAGMKEMSHQLLATRLDQARFYANGHTMTASEILLIQADAPELIATARAVVQERARAIGTDL